VLRAWRSKSSLATSLSRRRSCKVRLVSRSVVISFSSVFCAALASCLDSRYFLCQEMLAQEANHKQTAPPIDS
jgi:hypothetical protein